MKDRGTNNGALKVLKQVLISTSIVAITLFVFDLILIASGLFPPSYEKGDAELGWTTHAPLDGRYDVCLDMTRNERVKYFRNDIGVRSELSAAELAQIDDKLIVAAVGDSHSDLCMTNRETHQGVLQDKLGELGIHSIVLSNGVGRYSPLQAYLLFRERLREYEPDVVVMNLYTGNDFVDLLRVDDRPHFSLAEGEYVISEPVWMRYANPQRTYRSRVAFVIRKLADSTGVRNSWLRLRMLSDTVGSQDAGIAALVDYIQDVRLSVEPDVGYPGALAAQFLNQQLFLHHFPSATDESLNRVSALMQLANTENPETVFVMSPIPSYQLATDAADYDRALLKTLARLPINDEAAKYLERTLYYKLESISRENDWIFVDNLSALHAVTGDTRFYNAFDYHLTVHASYVIGENQAREIAKQVATRR